MTLTRIISFFVGLILATTVHAHGEGHAAPHGGQLIEAGDYMLEWVAKDNALYLQDHTGAQVTTEGAMGKIVAVGGGTKVTINLIPAGGNRLNLSEPLPAGNDVKAVISINLPGHAPVQARLERER